MVLKKFRVKCFRSINDTDWIDVEDVTALIGTNESGKTNVLLPLWKLSPTSGGDINLLQDLPRSLYKDLRDKEPKPEFIYAEYELAEDEQSMLADISNKDKEELKTIIVSKDYDNKLHFTFPEEKKYLFTSEQIKEKIQSTKMELEKVSESKTEESRKQNSISVLDSFLNYPNFSLETIEKMVEDLSDCSERIEIKTSTTRRKLSVLIDDLNEIIALSNEPSMSSNTELTKKITELMPKYVYYSNYGNLDSRIYLPRVINDRNRNKNDLTEKERAQIRTIETLFDYVNLHPEEILDLGRENSQNDKEIERTAQKKAEREILLESASSSFSNSFNDWWKQGDYKFSFRADGDYFKIWVSDKLRTESIELESRSAGLQWFFSFYLVFLVESKKSHKNAILLLDEPGVTLHPNAQKDLFMFFDGLSKSNQLIYTTHSPFMIDSNHLERVRSVYIDNEGYSTVSSDLRASERIKGKNQTMAVYPAHAALGLSVSEALLTNCLPVLVEGESDQFYLTGVKLYLISNGLFTPKKEIVFIPFGGTRSKGLESAFGILSSVTEGSPCIILDGDKSGKNKKESIQSLYKENKEKIICLSDFIPKIENCEIEDIFPRKKMASIITKYLPRVDDFEDEFSDVVKEDIPICDQVVNYCKERNIQIPKTWKIDIAKKVKTHLCVKDSKLMGLSDPETKVLVSLFEKIQELF